MSKVKVALLSMASCLLVCLPAPAQEPQSASTPAAGIEAAPEYVTIYQSRTYVATSTKEDHFEDNGFALQAGQDKLPLTMVVKNGADGKTPFNWFRININGYLVASEQNLKGKREGAVNLTGMLQPGGGQVIIDAAGEPGATMSFSLLAPPVILTQVEPDEVQAGGKIILTGSNFSTDESQDSVLVNDRPAEVLAAGTNFITARLPRDVQGGRVNVKVVVDGIPSRPAPLLVSSVPAPVLLSTNYWMAPPGAYLTITGRNFGADSSKLRVFFRGVPAQVLNSTPTSATVVVPNWSYGPGELNMPLYVVADGIRSVNALPFDIGPKYLGALPPIPGDSYSEASSQAGSQATSEAGSEATMGPITSPNANFGSSSSEASGGHFPIVLP